jgi:gas vesicle protein
MSRGRIILGVVIGLAAGAIVGILFAPDKGSTTRKNLIHKGETYIDDLKEKINSVLTDGRKRFEKVRESSSQAM